MKKQTKLGLITIDPQVFSDISARAAMRCFGVKGLAGGPLSNNIADMLKKDRLKKGVKLRMDGEQVFLELHIVVDHGVNIAALCRSIISEVTYQVSQLTGVQVGAVNVFVEGIV